MVGVGNTKKRAKISLIGCGGDLTADIKGNSQTVTPLDILRRASHNSSCSGDSLGAVFNGYTSSDAPFGQYLCVEKITDDDLCSLSRCLNATAKEHSIKQYCSEEASDNEDVSDGDNGEPDLMTQSELSTCRDAASTPGGSSTSHIPSPTPSSARTSLTTFTTQNNETTTATNGATPQTTSPTVTSTTPGSTNSAPGRRRSALDSTELFLALIVLIMVLL